MSVRHYSIQEALVDPGRVFGSPDNVISDPRLDRRAKLEILHKWRDDARSRPAGRHEGVERGELPMLRRVQMAIDRLGNSDDC